MKPSIHAGVFVLFLFLSINDATASKTDSSVLNFVGANSPPFLFIQKGVVSGIDAEIIKYLAGKLGVNYKIKLCPLVRCKRLLEQGDYDAGISFSRLESFKKYVIYPSVATRTSEYILITNQATKLNYHATSLNYVKASGFDVGVVRGNSYDQKLWSLFPWVDEQWDTYHPKITPLKDIATVLKMLNLDRIQAFPGERLSALYTANKLGLENITHYDFVAFFQPKFTVFSKKSAFKSKRYESITQLSVGFEQALNEFKDDPEFYRIFNWDWTQDKPYESSGQTTSTSQTGDPIHVGFLAALSGLSAGWGKPGLTGNQLFIDEVNAKGGLLVDGIRYPLKMFIYDDESNPKKALVGAKELVEKYKVKFINGIGGATADAIHPYLTQKKVVFASLIATDIRPDRPYLLAGGDVTPRIDMLRPWYHKNKNPRLTKWAVLSQNDPVARSSQAWEVGAAVAEGWEIVIDQHFPIDTRDFSLIIKQVLAKKPDVVSLNLTWPEFIPFILKELYEQGYRGEISANYLDVESNLKQVPEWFHEGVVDSFPLFNDPYWGSPSVQHDFYSKWMKRHGKGGEEELVRAFTGIDWDHVIMLKVWAFGAQLAGSFDPDAIITALRNQKSFPTLLGKGVMEGEEMWGIQNMVSPPIPINETRNGVKRIQTIKRFEEWFQLNKEVIINEVKSKGFYWNRP